MFRFPSPSLVVSMAALIVALGGAGYSATGGNFILGKANSASTQTALSASLNGRALQLTNSNAGGSATALGLNVAVGHPPFSVNSAVKVANLNADKLDGLDSTQFPRKLVVPFNLAAGGISAPIILPANLPVFVMGVTAGAGRGVGHASLLRSPGTDISWIAQEGTTNTAGFSHTAGTHIVFIDSESGVEIEVNSRDAIRIQNLNIAAPATGVVTLIW